MYTIIRTCKNLDSTETIWNNIKTNIIKYLSIKLKEKMYIKINKEKKIIELKCEKLNITIKFMSSTIKEDSKNDNLIFIKNNNNNDSKVVSIYNVSEDFYNFIT